MICKNCGKEIIENEQCKYCGYKPEDDYKKVINYNDVILPKTEVVKLKSKNGAFGGFPTLRLRFIFGKRLSPRCHERKQRTQCLHPYRTSVRQRADIHAATRKNIIFQKKRNPL